MRESERLYYYAFSRTGKIGPVHFSKISKHFSSIEEAWKKPVSYLRKQGLSESICSAIASVKKDVSLEREYQSLKESGIRLLTLHDEEYPDLLRQISDPPFILYVKGSFIPNDARSIAVVGARKQSSYGRSVVSKLVPEIVAEGFTVVSGLAMGNDIHAHKETLRAGGRTLAVMGSGLLNVTSSASIKCIDEILTGEQGAVVSEFHPFLSAYPYHFPLRNRIISGLSRAVLVVEASQKSGTLSTANHALSQGREVLAVPGSIHSPLSAGPHRLLSMGASLVATIENVLESVGADSRSDLTPEVFIPSSREEEVLFHTLGTDELHLDEIIRACRELSPSVVSSTISMMHLKGVLVDSGGGRYRLKQ